MKRRLNKCCRIFQFRSVAVFFADEKGTEWIKTTWDKVRYHTFQRRLYDEKLFDEMAACSSLK